MKHGKGVVNDHSWDVLNGVVALAHAVDPFKLSATFAIDGAVWIRSSFEAEIGPDVLHLTSRRDEKDGVRVMSSTSLVGVVRAQALRIARTVTSPNRDRADRFIEEMFGDMEKTHAGMTHTERRELKKQANRVTIDENVLSGQTSLIQPRVKIERFTGEVFESALFAEQLTFGGEFTLGLSLRAPQDAEVGLLLLVLKDLWTGFLPVGGSSSVGRGRLKGLKATIRYRGGEWTITAPADSSESINVVPSQGIAAVGLNKYVTAFINEMEDKA